MTTAAEYTEFAEREAHDVSPIYERLARAVSRDHDLIALLETLPPAKRQPNLLFGVVRFLGGPVEPPSAFHGFVVANWSAVGAELRIRATQTNEVGRCALLTPVLAALPQPLALLEVGASAGLCLYPDRYGYRYSGRTVGIGEPILECAATGMAPPSELPNVVWRAGLDLNPLDVLYRVSAPRRNAFAGVVSGLRGHWIANEAPEVLPYENLPDPPTAAMHNVLALDGKPLAWTRAHGQAMTWFG